jgi:tellurite resistance protein
MVRSSWFDDKSNELKFSEYVEKMDSWQKALADGVVQPEELQAQMERVAKMLRALEPKLSDEVHEQLTNILYELAVFYGMQRMAELTEFEKGEE